MTPLVERSLALRRVPLLASLPPEELIALASVAREVQLAPGDLLLREGELGDSLFLIQSGTLRVLRRGQEVARLGAGECVGELAVLDGEPRSASVQATASCRVYQLHRHDLLDLLMNDAEPAMQLALVLIQRLRSGREEHA